jgi:hypothetical protein
MIDHYTVAIGYDLYGALWDDPRRPKNRCVAEWAQILLRENLLRAKLPIAPNQTENSKPKEEAKTNVGPVVSEPGEKGTRPGGPHDV